MQSVKDIEGVQLRLLEVHLRLKLVNSFLYLLGDQGNHSLHEFLSYLHTRCVEHDGMTSCAPGATRLSGHVPLSVFEDFVRESYNVERTAADKLVHVCEIYFSEKIQYEFEMHGAEDPEVDEKKRTLIRYEDALRLLGHVSRESRRASVWEIVEACGGSVTGELDAIECIHYLQRVVDEYGSSLEVDYAKELLLRADLLVQGGSTFTVDELI